ncbi:carbon-nitrogen hydrolase family protein [Xanthobacter autotrophicus]|uniref:carbon-nitrogen hydrolase family protein n=1 Tax=Xanthobacter TaxID=279 RepID=UPI00145D27AB|nr:MULTISPECIES: carbon-nitrogen hydrolase family protein [Xanthobacter]NMN57767.1 nitrilase [Xanthobacter sp. SG618]UDQ90102.1 carbon-nitrogen hydrolase family protein [Xanthobacter autotrophicus]
MPRIKVAAVQAATIPFDGPAATQRTVALIAEAAATGAKIAVFPEAFIGGYPKGLDFGCSVGRRTAEGRADFVRYVRGAITVPGPEVDQLAAACAEHDIHVVVGVIERDGGTLHCTVLYLGPDGLLGKHRKVMPTGSERLVWGFGDGSTLTVVDTPHGKLGGAICWEHYMPLLRAAYYGKGVEIWAAPTADDRETWISTMRHVAMEGRCFVISACQVMRRSDFPEDYASRIEAAPDAWMMHGRSVIVGPLGEVLAGPVLDEETILTAEIDLDDIIGAKLDFDPIGHYARPDLFSLNVDEAPQLPVIARGEG